MQRVRAVPVLAAVAAIIFLICLPGCGGSDTNTSSIASTVMVTPSTISLNQGGVVTLSVVAQNSSGVAVAADISFSSSNNNIATVSAGGLICGGVWDAAYINCNATLGSGGVGVVTITATATANGVKANATVYVHDPVDQVNMILAGQLHQHGPAGKCLRPSAQAPRRRAARSTAPCDITSTVGPIAFGSNDTSIVSTNAAGHLVAVAPGATTVFASNSGVNSVGTPYTDLPGSQYPGAQRQQFRHFVHSGAGRHSDPDGRRLRHHESIHQANSHLGLIFNRGGHGCGYWHGK